jgi:hypothetical protein
MFGASLFCAVCAGGRGGGAPVTFSVFGIQQILAKRAISLKFDRFLHNTMEFN